MMMVLVRLVLCARVTGMPACLKTGATRATVRPIDLADFGKLRSFAVLSSTMPVSFLRSSVALPS